MPFDADELRLAMHHNDSIMEAHPELVPFVNFMSERPATPDEIELGATLRAEAAALLESEAPAVHRLGPDSPGYKWAEGVIVAYLVNSATPSSEGN